MALIAAGSRGAVPGSQGRAALAQDAAGVLDAGCRSAEMIGRPRHGVPGLAVAGAGKGGVPGRRGGVGRHCQTGISRFPSHDYKLNQAWLTAAMMAQILLAWLKVLALDGDLAKAEPKTLRYRVLHAAARLVRGGAPPPLEIPRPAGPGPKRSLGLGSGAAHYRTPADQHGPVPATCGGNPRARGTPAPGPTAGP